MIWPLRKKKEVAVIPVLKEIIFADDEGAHWKYKPVKHITANEVALLLPVFISLTQLCDRWTYIKEHKLDRHFERVE